MISERDSLDARIIGCAECPRLRSHCRAIAKAKKKMFAAWDYWGRPVPNFGDPACRLLIVGLAPAAHGANRTGRMFTGDQSGVWLYRALHRAGYANQAESVSRQDGLQLTDCLVTAVCHCAPPDNKPNPEEIQNCSHFLRETLHSAKDKKVILALGGIAWKAILKNLPADWCKRSYQSSEFTHGAEIHLPDGVTLLGSYHPSQQNTYTGRLTESAFDRIFERCKELIHKT